MSAFRHRHRIGARSFRRLALCLGLLPAALAGQTTRAPLAPADIDDIAQLVLLEDRRTFDSTALARLLASAHPEVRRRAAQSIGRIADRRGLALLRTRPADPDTAVTATMVWAVGQLRDTASVAWLDSVLSAPTTAPTVMTEAAHALGKIKSPAAGEVLSRFLLRAPATARDAVGAALLAIGRIVPRVPIAPMTRWSTSPDEELRWRATWALFRPRDPRAVVTLLRLSADPSPLVRSWAVRGLTRAQADSGGILGPARTALMKALGDTDRRVQAEAVTALVSYGDTAAAAALTAALKSPDAWVSVNAATGLGIIKATTSIPALLGATNTGRPCALRLVAMQSLQSFSPNDALTAAIRIVADTVPYCRLTALQRLTRDSTARTIGSPVLVAIERLANDPLPAIRLAARQAVWTARDGVVDIGARRRARTSDIAAADPAVRAAALRSMTPWADSADLPTLLDAWERGLRDSVPTAASAAVAVIGTLQRNRTFGAAQFLARFQAPADPTLRRDAENALGAAARTAWGAPPVAPVRTLAEYRTLVERWIVPDYNGAPRPVARWETPRGPIDLELFPGDAPLGTEEFVRLVESGAIVGTQFTRVVADFVDQQERIPGSNRLRDEVNRRGLVRANLAWATAGLDTGSPGYTLGHTPQPHNEGDFTSLGRVIKGLEAMDRIQLGDRITAARMLSGGRP